MDGTASGFNISFVAQPFCLVTFSKQRSGKMATEDSPFFLLQSKTEQIIDITLKISTRSYTWLLLWCPSFHCAPMPGKLMGLLSYVTPESMFLTLSLVIYKVETFSHNVDCLFCHDMSCGITPYGRAITKLIFTGGGL